MNKLRAWTLKHKESPYAAWILFFIAFSESSFFPIPPDVLLIAILALNTSRWKRYAFIVLAGSLLGAVAGYWIGWGFYSAFGQRIVDFYHLQTAVDAIGVKYSQNAFLTIFIAAFTPIPYKVITISAGLFQINFLTFILASLVGRGVRFFGVGFLMKLFGPQIERVLEKYFNIASLIFIILLVGGFLLLRYVL